MRSYPDTDIDPRAAGEGRLRLILMKPRSTEQLRWNSELLRERINREVQKMQGCKVRDSTVSSSLARGNTRETCPAKGPLRIQMLRSVKSHALII